MTELLRLALLFQRNDMYIFIYSTIHFLLIVLAVLFQVSFFQPLDAMFYNLNVVYFIISLLLFYDRIYLFLVWLIVGGFFLDSLSSFPFGFFLAIFLISVSLMYILLMKFLTNRSIYALVLYEIIALVIFNSVLYCFAYISEIFLSLNLGLTWGNYFYLLRMQIFIVLIATLIVYLTIKYIVRPLIKFFF